MAFPLAVGKYGRGLERKARSFHLKAQQTAVKASNPA